MDAIIVILTLLFLSVTLIKVIVGKFNDVSEGYLWGVFFVHIVFSAVYLYFAFDSTSDSFSYYRRSSNASDWFSLWGMSTTFIDFLAWPFSNFLGLSYLSTMFIFSWFGFAGVVFFYLAAKENVRLAPVWGKLTPVELVFLIPNLHHWSSSLGKGSVILVGLALFTYGLSRFNRRYFTMLAGAFIVLMARPHILLAVLLGIILSLVFKKGGMKSYVRYLILAVSFVGFFYLSEDVVEFSEVENLNILSSDFLSNRAAELSKSTSGVNLQSYSLPLKMFTFWFRPLFFDGLGMLGILGSLENTIFLIMFYIILRYGLPNWKHWNGWFIICFFVFLLGSLALAQVTGNLGIAIRQKSQLMPYFFILYLKALQYKNEGVLVKRNIRT